MERAIETAAPLAQLLRANVSTSEAFNECDFGDWTGLTFEALDLRPDWRTFNEQRCYARAPSGESLFDVQNRAVNAVKGLMERSQEPDSIVFTHADVIRSVICFFTGTPLDSYMQYPAHPASLTIFENSGGTLRLATRRSSGVHDLL
jgi:probable phosphoglycerate mutase